MSAGRGRGYTGRHARPEPRPGDDPLEDEPRTLPDLTPRSPGVLSTPPESAKIEPRDLMKQDLKMSDKLECKDSLELRYANLKPEDEMALTELLAIDEQYRPLLVLLEQFSPGEDGIQFNRKLRHFESTVASMCPDETRLLQAFSTFRAAALASGGTARRLAAVGACFTRQQRQQLLRSTLLNVVMQGTFAKLDVLERANPQYLINAANLMGDYFAEARLCNGNKVHILAAPLLQYMKALLMSDDIRAHRSLATQLIQNGRELLSVLGKELDELTISIRRRLLTPPPVSIIWLLLSADLCLNQFLPLPNFLQRFYASHLDLIQEDQNNSYSEVGYGTWKKTPENEDAKPADTSELSLAEKVSQNISQLNLSHEEDGMKPKLRPILGAGAGLLRQEQQNHVITASQDSFEASWTPKSLSKRYDLNSWRQTEEEVKEDNPEPVFNPTIPPPSYTNIPDYPPPTVNRFNNFQENFPNYLQQGDGAFIQNQFPERQNPFPGQGDSVFVPGQQFVQSVDRNNQLPERVNNEVQKNSSRRSIENWRKEKSETREEKKNWTRQKSKDNLHDEVSEEKGDKYRNSRPNSRENRPGNRQNRRSSVENSETVQKARRHVSDVPRSQKYWDHDDRCDIDYTS